MIQMKCGCGEVIGLDEKHFTIRGRVAVVKKLIFCGICIKRYSQGSELPIVVWDGAQPDIGKDDPALPDGYLVWNRMAKERLIK